MTRAAAGSPRIGVSSPPKARGAVDRYFRQSETPLASLVFILPALVIFEFGTWLHPSNPIAFNLLHQFFLQFGATRRFLPAGMMVVILLACHIARKAPWHVGLDTLMIMMIESWTLSLPLLALGSAVSRWNLHDSLFAADQWRDSAILSVGAGIYEELVFRLMLMTILALIFADLIEMPGFWTNLLMVCISAVMFSLYHYLGSEQFKWQTFVFRTGAGIYFAILFLQRGFGVTSGCHIFYDLIIVSFQVWSSP